MGQDIFAVRGESAPNGCLRVAINPGNPVLAQGDELYVQWCNEPGKLFEMHCDFFRQTSKLMRSPRTPSSCISFNRSGETGKSSAATARARSLPNCLSASIMQRLSPA